MRGHYYTTNPTDATNHIRGDGLVLEGVACYIYRYTGSQQQPPVAGTAKFFQLYDRTTDFRFYTADENEVVTLFGTHNYDDENPIGWVYWPDPPSGITTTKLYRLRNLSTNEHFYTTSTVEFNTLNGHGWVEENPPAGAGYVFNPGQAPEGTIPMYRLFKQ